VPREWSTDLEEIHQAYRRRDTLDLYLNDDSELHLSRGSVTRSLVSYENVIRSVSDLRGTIDAGVDRVTINCQNVDSLLGFNLASNLRLLDYAIADYGRIYQSERNLSLKEDIPEFFRGVLANAECDEQNISFEFIDTLESLGSIVASRSLSPLSAWRSLNGIEVTAAATVTNPKTRADFIANGKEWEFGGWEFFEEPVSNLPGTGGNDGGTGTGTCFPGHTKIWTPRGEFSFSEIDDRFQNGINSIYSFNPHTGEVEIDEIEEIFIHQSSGYFTLEFEHREVDVTREHPFLIDWGLFRPADGFNRLDTTKIFLTESKTWVNSRLLKIKWNSDLKETVFNCRVKKNGTYFANGCAVHNSKIPEIEL
jgi:hypothetical protein